MATLIIIEMGKTLREARAEIRTCATLASWMAAHGPALLADELALVPADEGKVSMSTSRSARCSASWPWNSPFWQVLRAAVPVPLGGNTFVLKHAPNVQGCAGALLGVFERSGAPRDVLRGAQHRQRRRGGPAGG